MASSLCSLNLLHSLGRQSSRYLWLKPVTLLSSRYLCLLSRQAGISCRRLVTVAATEGSTKSSQSDETVPSWARPDSDEPPPWASDERNESAKPTVQIPFYAYLLASTVAAIAAIGSMFEYANQKPVFGVLNSDSVFYAPLLGFFAFTGIPTSAFLWYKSVQVANKEAEEQDRRDGYL